MRTVGLTRYQSVGLTVADAPALASRSLRSQAPRAETRLRRDPHREAGRDSAHRGWTS